MSSYLSGILKFALVNIYVDMPNKLWYYVGNRAGVFNMLCLTLFFIIDHAKMGNQPKWCLSL